LPATRLGRAGGDDLLLARAHSNWSEITSCRLGWRSITLGCKGTDMDWGLPGMSGPDRLDDRAIVLETIDSMLDMRILSVEMRSRLEELRGRVETFGSAADQSDDE
jgi:hypothetical protein